MRQSKRMLISFIAIFFAFNFRLLAQQNDPNAASLPSPAEQERRAQLQANIRRALEFQLTSSQAELKYDLNVSDDEMVVIWPKYLAIGYGRNFFGIDYHHMGTGFLMTSDDFGLQMTEVIKAVQELQKAVDDPASTPEQLADKLHAVRQLLDKHYADLQSAYDDLRKILTTRQEAMCVIRGFMNVLPSKTSLAALPSTQPAGVNDADDPSQAQARGQGRELYLQSMLTQAKKDLVSTNLDLSVLGPMIEKCIELHDTALSRYGLGLEYSRSGVARGMKPVLSPLPPARTPTGLAEQELDRMLHDKDKTTEQIQAQMQAVGLIEQQADDDYAAASKELQSHLTRRQEAILFLDGVLK